LKQARILFGELPRLTRDIVEGAIESQRDMRVVGHSGNASLDPAIRRLAANIVIVHDGVVADDLPLQLVCRHPHVKVVAITDEGDAANVYEFRAVHLADPSPAALIDAIRAVLEEAE